MQLEYLPQLIMLIAGAITCIITLVKRFEVLTSLEILLGVLIGFYIIGLIAKKIIMKTIEETEGTKKEEREVEKIETGKEAETNTEEIEASGEASRREE